jgi:hypothetical protein
VGLISISYLPSSVEKKDLCITQILGYEKMNSKIYVKSIWIFKISFSMGEAKLVM